MFLCLLTVTHSLIVVLFPIIVNESSPSNFKSWGTAEITAPGKILQFSPIRAPSIIVTFDPIQVPEAISTFLWIVAKGSMTTFLAILASGWIYAKGWFIIYFFFGCSFVASFFSSFFFGSVFLLVVFSGSLLSWAYFSILVFLLNVFFDFLK